MDSDSDSDGEQPSGVETFIGGPKKLRDEVVRHNATMIEDIIYPKKYSADDRIFDLSVVSGLKNKKALEIRSHWNTPKLKRYFDYELGVAEDEHREWWSRDTRELENKHVVI